MIYTCYDLDLVILAAFIFISLHMLIGYKQVPIFHLYWERMFKISNLEFR